MMVPKESDQLFKNKSKWETPTFGVTVSLSRVLCKKATRSSAYTVNQTEVHAQIHDPQNFMPHAHLR